MVLGHSEKEPEPEHLNKLGSFDARIRELRWVVSWRLRVYVVENSLNWPSQKKSVQLLSLCHMQELCGRKIPSLFPSSPVVCIPARWR
jgi:hypothetical protein